MKPLIININPSKKEAKKNIDIIMDIKKLGFRIPIIPKIGHNGAMIMKTT